MNKIKLLEATQGKPVWVWREDFYDESCLNDYRIYAIKELISTPEDVSTFCPEDFERFTGLKLNPGEYTRIRFGVSPVDVESRIRELEKAVSAVNELINSTHGVAGLHLNGDIANWDELLAGGRFEEWLSPLSEALND